MTSQVDSQAADSTLHLVDTQPVDMTSDSQPLSQPPAKRAKISQVVITPPAKKQKFGTLKPHWVYDLTVASGEEDPGEDGPSKDLQEIDVLNLKDKATNTMTWDQIMAEKSYEWKLHQDIMPLSGMRATYFR